MEVGERPKRKNVRWRVFGGVGVEILKAFFGTL